MVGPQKMSELLNEHFSSVFSVEKDLGVIECGEIQSVVLKRVHVTEEENLQSGHEHIKVDKSPGLDQVNTKTLWETGKENVRPPYIQ